ncbi:MAG: aldehyde dehydrogenase family protein [Acidimicrobiia bacterium]
MQDRDKLYIDGAWVPSTGSNSINVINAATEAVMGRIPEGTPEDVDCAVAAAKAAFASWRDTPADERAKYILRLQEGLASRMQEIAEVITGEVGMPITFSSMIQAGLPTAVMGSYVEIVTNFAFEEQMRSSLVVREPVGVVGCITPWNYPMHQIVAKVAPALGAGCTVVLKPSEVAPFSAFILAEIIDDVGLPAGVFNLVSGTGPVVGEAIARHPDVAMVSFTGSTRAGKRVAEIASDSVKRVALELGGKSPFIILDGAPIDEAVTAGIGSCFMNSGQTCSAWTRMLVPRSQHDEIVAKVKEIAEGYPVGDPTDPTHMGLGPLISDTQRTRVRDYIQKGIDEGATLVTGGVEAPEGLDTGYYVRPTVFANVSNDMTIAQEEIFGPVLSVIPYDSEEEAIEIANATIYGLHAGVFGPDRESAMKVARKLDAGQVDINGQKFNPVAPFGGYKQSGSGRELGRYGLEEYLEVKALQL